MRITLGLLLILPLTIMASNKSEVAITHKRFPDVAQRSFNILERELAASKSIDARVQAGLALLPYNPYKISTTLLRTLQEGRASSVLTDSTVDRLIPYLSPRLVRYARRAARKNPAPRWALRLLAYAGEEQDLATMERYFTSPAADHEMIGLLANYGRQAIPLAEKLMHRSSDESCRAAILITELADTAHYDEMELYGKNNLCLAWNFAELEPERARPLIFAHLESDNAADRRDAVYAAGTIGDSAYLPSLSELLADPDTFVVCNAAFALGFYGDTSGAPILRQAASDTASALGAHCERLLSSLPDALIQPVLHNLLSADCDVATRRAANAAGKMKDSSALPCLINLLEKDSRSLQRAGIDALALIGDASARGYIRPFLVDENLTLRIRAALALGALADTAAVAKLSIMLFWEVGPKGEQGWIRHPIVDALVMIGDTSALPALALMLEEADPYLALKVLRMFEVKAANDYIPYVEPLLESTFAPLRVQAATAILAMAQR